MTDIEFVGSEQNIFNYLTEELKISTQKPSATTQTGNFQLIPLTEQIQRISSSTNKIGKIYYTHHYLIEDKNTETGEIELNEAFEVKTVKVQIKY